MSDVKCPKCGSHLHGCYINGDPNGDWKCFVCGQKFNPATKNLIHKFQNLEKGIKKESKK